MPLPASATFDSFRVILAATRCWRCARDDKSPVQPALYAALDAYRVGMLAPVFAGLFALYESCSGKPILVGDSGPAGISSDERCLFSLLDGPGDSGAMTPIAAIQSGLDLALRIAVQSARIMMRHALEPIGDFRPPQRLHAIVGGCNASARKPDDAYRNRSLAALVDILRAAYRVTARILGESGFDAAALAFARRFPPVGPTPAGYGRGFADFLAEQLPATDIPYLADVATLERLWTESQLAPDAPALDLGDLSRSGAAVWAMRRLPLHPAARFIWLSTPALSVWQSYEGGGEATAVERGALGALVTRRHGRVELRTIRRPEHRMLCGLRLGERIGQAAGATTALYPEADIALLFANLVGSGAFARPPPESLRY